MKIIHRITDALVSLRLSLWLLGAIMALFIGGALYMPMFEDEYQTMNNAPLFRWLIENPFKLTWWLWAAIAVLAALTLNTVSCSVESVYRKRGMKNLMLIVSPQIIHIAFIFMLIAHFVSAQGAAKAMATAEAGSHFDLPGGVVLQVKDIDVTMSERGYPIDFSAHVQFSRNQSIIRTDVIAPNEPSFIDGFGVYIKNATPYPAKQCLIEVSREPGAPWALAGGVLFTIGTILLFAFRIIRER